MTDKIVVLSTCGTQAEAERIAHLLVEQQVAACVNVLPGVKSFYRWKGAVETANEWMLVVKSSRELFDRLRLALESAHSYEVPEVVAMQVVDGSLNYLNWIEESLRP